MVGSWGGTLTVAASSPWACLIAATGMLLKGGWWGAGGLAAGGDATGGGGGVAAGLGAATVRTFKIIIIYIVYRQTILEQ